MPELFILSVFILLAMICGLIEHVMEKWEQHSYHVRDLNADKNTHHYSHTTF